MPESDSLLEDNIVVHRRRLFTAHFHVSCVMSVWLCKFVSKSYCLSVVRSCDIIFVSC